MGSFLLPFANSDQAMGQSAGSSKGQSQATSIDLNGTWMMKDYTRSMGTEKKIYLPENEPAEGIPCQVPGTARTALLEAGQIPDPYVGFDNEKSLWTEQKEWWFFKSFDVPEELEGKYIDLVFEGILFKGECWVNGKPAGNLKGMLNPRSFDVTRLLNYGGENKIAVRLEAPADAWSSTMKDNLTWFTQRDQLYSIAQCMYGWDWGPHGVNIGIWKPVKLLATGEVRVNHPAIRTTIPSPKKAVCDVQVQVRNLSGKPVSAVVAGSVVEKDTKKEAATFKQSVDLAAGESRVVHFSVNVKKPKLWWPNGMGEQNLYLLNTAVSVNQTQSDFNSTQFGIREIKLVDNENKASFIENMKNQEGLGNQYSMGKAVGSYPWTFQINGKKMFAKGGNWIPVDQLLRLDRSRYDRLLTLFKNAHFNLIRVWGGGLYETDDFYDLCDEYGILNWQEFLSNRNFSHIDRDNFLEGAKSAILRIRNHPSLTFWCGGNEFDPDDQGSKAVIDSLANLLSRLDPEREFHRASPYMGDDHYWGVWHGQEPYTAYRKVRPFRSEAGINALPVWENYQKFTPKELIWPPDTVFIEYHGEYNTNYAHLGKLMRYTNEFGTSSDMPDLIMKSQLYQALADEFDLEFCRSNKFRNSGFLVWQYNDIWPCLSWSIVDWYGTPKAAYYFMKRGARPVHITADFASYLWKAGDDLSADIYLLNDNQEQVNNLSYKATLFDAEGNVLAEKSGKASISANSTAKPGSIDYQIPETMKGKTVFVSAEVFGPAGEKISDVMYPLAVSKNEQTDNYKDIFVEMNKMPTVSLELKPVSSDISFLKNGSAETSIQITNPTQHLALFIRTRISDKSASMETEYNDNYISLLPGETKTIKVNFQSTDLKDLRGEVNLEVSGYNVEKQSIKFKVSKAK